MFIIPSNYQNSNFTKYLPHLQHSQTKENHGLSCLNSYGWSQNTHKITMFHTFSSPNKYTNRFWVLSENTQNPMVHGLSLRIGLFFGTIHSQTETQIQACLGPPRWVRQRSSGTVQRPVARAGSQGESWGVWGPWGSWDFQRAPHSKTKGIWWRLTYPLWKIWRIVSWDDDIPNIWKIKVMFQTTNQEYNGNTS